MEVTMRDILCLTVLLVATLAHGSDPALGCYGRQVEDNASLVDYDPIRLTNWRAPNRKWYPHGARVAELVHPEASISATPGYWVRVGDSIEVTFTDDGRMGHTSELTPSPSGFEGRLWAFNDFVRMDGSSRDVWTRQPCSTPLPPFPYGNTWDLDNRAILAFPKDDDSVPGLFTSLNGRRFTDPPPTVFAKPITTKVGYYCKSRDAERFITLELEPEMLYAFQCVNDIQAEVTCGMCK